LETSPRTHQGTYNEIRTNERRSDNAVVGSTRLVNTALLVSLTNLSLGCYRRRPDQLVSIRTLIARHLPLLTQQLRFSTRRSIAHSVVSGVLKNETDRDADVLDLCRVLMKDQTDDTGRSAESSASRSGHLLTGEGLHPGTVASPGHDAASECEQQNNDTGP